MSRGSCISRTALLVAAVFASACSNEVASPDGDLSNLPPAVASVTTAPVCQTITFNTFSHGNQVTSVALAGMTINFAVSSFLQPNGSPNSQNFLRAWNTNIDPTNWEDKDLAWTPPGICAGCNGLGRILVIEDERGFNPWGDYRWGGVITLTGFAPNTWIQRFTVVDDNLGEPPIVLRVDGVQVGASTPQGEALVQVVNTTSQPVINTSATFTLGTSAVDQVTGSGGLDNIKVCTREELGDEGCTPGYWKNHPGSWAPTGFTTGQSLESVFDVPNSLGLDNVSLLAALSLPGGSGVQGGAQILLRAAVAALLNAAHPGVDYPRTTASIIADVNAALASGSRSTMLALATALDADNNLGCPLN